MKKMVAAMMLFLLISTQMKSVEPDAADCLDGCSTACVQSDFIFHSLTPVSNTSFMQRGFKHGVNANAALDAVQIPQSRRT
ncbi:hypothetical protein GmHk_08G022518 [Glycine max]|nr:hypothetical protein GmHk_08G022518 [Glycine max]